MPFVRRPAVRLGARGMEDFRVDKVTVASSSSFFLGGGS